VLQPFKVIQGHTFVPFANCDMKSPILPKNALMGTLMGTYSNTVIGTLAVDGWAVTFGTARMGMGGAAANPVPSSLYKM